jgi:hypothetical protein
MKDQDEGLRRIEQRIKDIDARVDLLLSEKTLLQDTILQIRGKQ